MNWASAVVSAVSMVDRSTTADRDVVTASGNTPLMLAAIAGKGTVVTHLLKSGVKVDARNREGNTALMLAAQWGRKDIVEQLLASQADASSRVRAFSGTWWRKLRRRPAEGVSALSVSIEGRLD